MSPVIEQRPALADVRVLVVDDEPALAELISDVVRDRLKCEAVIVSSLREARRVLDHKPIHLLVTDVHLPDGDGRDLLPLLQRQQPSAQAIVITGTPSMDGAIDAMRQGAADFLPKPFDAQLLTDRLRSALQRQAQNQYRTRRMKTLREAVKRLNEARKLVTRKVDLLCNDLITAYSELSKQVDIVRLQEGYTKLIGGTLDLEQLLCHTMDWLMRQLGYANVGVWLAADESQFNLGAYMKYTIPGEAALTDAIERNLLRMAVRKGFVHLSGPEVKELLTPPELEHLKNQDIVAVNCTYLGDTLGVIVMFRDAKTPFTEDDIHALRTVSPLFAVQLTKAVKAQDAGENDAAPGEAEAAGDVDPSAEAGPAPDDEPGNPPPKPKARKPKIDPADWWKRGEPPPF